MVVPFLANLEEKSVLLLWEWNASTLSREAAEAKDDSTWNSFFIKGANQSQAMSVKPLGGEWLIGKDKKLWPVAISFYSWLGKRSCISIHSIFISFCYGRVMKVRIGAQGHRAPTRPRTGWVNRKGLGIEQSFLWFQRWKLDRTVASESRPKRMKEARTIDWLSANRKRTAFEYWFPDLMNQV